MGRWIEIPLFGAFHLYHEHIMGVVMGKKCLGSLGGKIQVGDNAVTQKLL